jgi:TatD DNase family protein
MFSTPEQQRTCFENQLRLAVELKLPVFLHQRKGFEVFTEIMDREWPAEIAQRAVVHCFTGDAKELKHFVSRGYMIGLTGLVCDQKRGAVTRKAIAQGLLPLERLVRAVY